MSAASLLRRTTEEMANRASVPMDVWDRHSNAALQAADRIEALEAICRAYLERGEYQTMCSQIRAALNDTETTI